MDSIYQQLSFTTLAFSFGLLHLILYVYNKNFKSHLYFSIFAILYALSTFFDFQALMTTEEDSHIIFLRIHRTVMPYNMIFALLFIYKVTDLKIPKQFWFYSGLIAISGFFSILKPNEYFDYVQYGLIILIFEMIRVLYTRKKTHPEVIRFIGTGFIFLFLFSMYDVLMDFELIDGIYSIQNGYPFGFLILIISMSIYLARDISNANQTIIDQAEEAKEAEIKRRILEAEDSRKSKELEEARQLQVSMLPECNDEIGSFEACLSMRTAVEVGGDYYDYHLSEDGTLTIVIGDATGHGMKAGVLVSIVKSQFMSHSDHDDIPSLFTSISKTIKSMKMGNLFMALMVIRINDETVQISSAGMPPLYIYRKESDTIEEILIKGMPLGALKSYPYESKSFSIHRGDSILMLSDGLIELFNSNNEMLEIEKIIEQFRKSSSKHPNDIVEDLYKLGDDWRGDRDPDDDLTLLVLKKK